MRRGLLATTLLSSLCWAGAAAAQDGGNQLEEVVVTATRQADTVNRVPLSVSAQTQRNLDQQGIRNLTDLQAFVPALNSNQLAPSTAQVTIRGIANTTNASTAPTTGFYLDDTPIQKRNTGGGVGTNNGTPLPPLFDLERVEVLRGPQGTLYGGSSQGGTIRYITPQPSLTRYSEYMRGEVSHTKDGGTNYEGGVAVGGPIVQDKLGFRASVFARHDSGVIDFVHPLSREIVDENVNSRNVRLFRGAIAWAPTEQSRVTLAWLSSRDHSNSVNFGYNQNTQYPIVEPTTCYNTVGVTDARPNNLPTPVAFGNAACAAAVAAGAANFTRPGATYAPFTNLGPYKLIETRRSPATTLVSIPSLTLDYDFGNMTMKSITSYIQDSTKSVQADTTFNGQRAIGIQNTQPGGSAAGRAAPFSPPGTLLYDVEGRYGPYVLRSGPGFSALYPDAPMGNSRFFATNRRWGVSQEIRFASANTDSRFSWVAGVFYSNMRGSTIYTVHADLERYARALFGLTAAQRYSIPPLIAEDGSQDRFDFHTQKLKDVEVAAFGEGNYWVIPEKLRVTVGLRQSRVTFDYENYEIGPGNGFNVATLENGGISYGSIQESPFTPKFGAQYNFAPDKMVYVSASKGFRAGGVNVHLSPNVCAFGMGLVGLTVDDAPETFGSDTVWSYEAGTKLRLFDNRVQFNASAYRIDWSDVQISTNIGCGVPFVVNGEKARSQGVEIETQARVFRGLTMNFALGYNDAKYLEDAFGPAPSLPGNWNPVKVALKDQPFPIAPWTVAVGARYEADLAQDTRFYVRGDYRYTSDYKTSIYGQATYSPDTYKARQSHRANLRMGVEYKDFDINLFVNNIFNYDKGVTVAGGRGTCNTSTTAACENYSAYNPITTENGFPQPRTIGLQVAFRH